MELNFFKNGNRKTVSEDSPLPTREQRRERFGAVISATPTGAGDYFGYIENKSNVPLIVSIDSMITASTEGITVELSTAGTPASPVSWEIGNLRAGGGNLTNTNAVVQTGVDLNSASGLKTGSFVRKLIAAANTFYQVNWQFILLPGTAVQLKADTGTALIIANVLIELE